MIGPPLWSGRRLAGSANRAPCHGPDRSRSNLSSPARPGTRRCVLAHTEMEGLVQCGMHMFTRRWSCRASLDGGRRGRDPDPWLTSSTTYQFEPPGSTNDRRPAPAGHRPSSPWESTTTTSRGRRAARAVASATHQAVASILRQVTASTVADQRPQASLRSSGESGRWRDNPDGGVLDALPPPKSPTRRHRGGDAAG